VAGTARSSRSHREKGPAAFVPRAKRPARPNRARRSPRGLGAKRVQHADHVADHMQQRVFLDFRRRQLGLIRAPTMIMSGEFDFLTPRQMQDTLRVQIPDSALVIIPRAYHAFTLERAELAAYLTARFAEDVLAGRWRGKKTIWIAPEEVGGELTQFPEGYDHLRSIPVSRS
jgi:pimeloyl-ACP methyl ester carboxylesterase